MLSKDSLRRRPTVASECGQGLVELLIALTMLAIAITALLALLTSSALALQRSGKRGTALTLANKQLELYRSLGYANIRLYGPSIPTGSSTCPNIASDPYVSAHCGDPGTGGIPVATSEVVGETTANQIVGGSACTSALPECQATQVIPAASSPDHYDYRVDTYITYRTPTGGRQLKQVYVVVRDNRTTGKPILARNASTFDQSNAATG